jgi:hypothetical protein
VAIKRNPKNILVLFRGIPDFNGDFVENLHIEVSDDSLMIWDFWVILTEFRAKYFDIIWWM